MGTYHEVATGKFIAKNKKEFFDGLKGYVSGGLAEEPKLSWSGGTKKGNNVEIQLSDLSFTRMLWKPSEKEGQPDNELDLFQYIQKQLPDAEEAIIHLVSYEHPSDMCIYKYTINKNEIEEKVILEQ